MTSGSRKLQLDKHNAKWLGVCAGVANFLDVEAWTVRMVFLGSCIFGGWFLIPGYFITWYMLENDTGKVKDTFFDNPAVKHFRSVDYRKKLYRNKQEGKIGGVCAGIADYLEVDVTMVRVIFVVMLCLTGFPFFFYLGAMFVLDKRPVEEYRYYQQSAPPYRRDHAEQSFARNSDTESAGEGVSPQPSRSGNGQARTTRGEHRTGSGEQLYSQRREFQYCARKFATLQERLARLEAYVTSNKFRLQREFRNMS